MRLQQFFFDSAATDETYVILRDAVDAPKSEDRAFVEELWHEAAPHLDRDLPRLAASQFHARFWEMYLVVSMLRLSVPVRTRAQRRFAARGPDLQIGDVASWVEAIAPKAGETLDAVPAAIAGEIRSFPDEQIKLRLLGALKEKNDKLNHYLSDETVAGDEPYVVAINPAAIPGGATERPDALRILRTLFPIGHEVLHFDAEAGNFTHSSHEHQAAVVKSGGAQVPTTVFQDSAYSGISAVLYSCSAPWERPNRIGEDLYLVHNPLASNRLDSATIPVRFQWELHGEKLRRIDLLGSTG